METFTNNRDTYLKQIKKELLQYEAEGDWKNIFTYVQIPFFLRYGFSYNWSINIQNSKYRLLRKEWNAAYDHSRFDKGIYNIDRLAIIKKEIKVKPEEIKFLNSIKYDKINTLEFKGIILDGLICKLIIEETQKILVWNIDDEMNQELILLINEIRSWKREMKDL